MNDLRPRRPFVLIVEDDDDVRVGLTRLFQDCEYDVRTVRDGSGFAELVSRALLLDDLVSPAVIITDVRLPDFDGLGVVEGMRLAGWNVPVFVISGLPPDEIAPRIERIGGARLFSKPIDIDRLMTAVRAAVEPTLARDATS